MKVYEQIQALNMLYLIKRAMWIIQLIRLLLSGGSAFAMLEATEQGAVFLPVTLYIVIIIKKMKWAAHIIYFLDGLNK